MSQLRLAVVVTHPIQYHAPLYRLLARSCRVRPEVLFLSEHGVRPTHDEGFGRALAYDVPLTEGYEHRFLRNLSPRPGVERTGGTLNPALMRLLTPSRFDAVLVHGYSQLSHWLAFGTARARSLPYLLRGESSLEAEAGTAPRRLRVKRALVGRLVAEAGACLAIGERNRRFYRSYGAAPERIVEAPYSVDNDRFRGGGARGRARRAERLATVGLDPSLPVVLFAGKLQPWKRPGDVVAALHRMRIEVNGVFAGDGPLRRDLEAAADPGRVRVLGFVNQVELPEWYGAADVLVLPSSHEPWGLAVNEAIAAGCVPVVSNAVGCGPDLVGSDRVYPVGDVDALASVLDRFCAEPDTRTAARRQGDLVIGRFSLEATAAGIERGSLVAVGVGGL